MSDRELAAAWWAIGGSVLMLVLASGLLLYFKGAPRLLGIGWYAPWTAILAFLFAFGALAGPFVATIGMMDIDARAQRSRQSHIPAHVFGDPSEPLSR